MAFAKASREVKIPQQNGPKFELQELNNLPFNRREISQWNKEFAKSVGKYEPLFIELFEKAPVLEMGDCDDEKSIQKNRDYYTSKITVKASYVDTTKKNSKF